MSIEPTQADRDAAAAWAKTQSHPIRAAILRRGSCDNAPLVQAFARHRLASTPASGEVVAWMYRWKVDGEYVNWRYSDASNYHKSLDGYEETPLYKHAAPAHPAADLVEALRKAESAIAEYYRYWTGGETRGSYDGKPERQGLWEAQRDARAALSRYAGGA